jgi:hypothetical protein
VGVVIFLENGVELIWSVRIDLNTGVFFGQTKAGVWQIGIYKLPKRELGNESATYTSGASLKTIVGWKVGACACACVCVNVNVNVCVCVCVCENKHELISSCKFCFIGVWGRRSRTHGKLY